MSERPWSKTPWRLGSSGLKVFDADARLLGKFYGTYADISVQQRHANARLFLAAPALFEACELVYNEAKLTPWARNAVYNALKAAKGETHEG